MTDFQPDWLTEKRLRVALGERSFQFIPQIGSTSDVAREWAASGAPNGAIVITEEQIAGRGRFTRRWHAPPGSALLFSMIICLPPVLIPYANRLSIIGALAVVAGTEQFGAADVTLKWPNDVLLHGRKLAGILAESDWDAQTLRAVILGIGVNIRVRFDTAELVAADPLTERAISLEPTIDHPIDRTLLLAAILEKVAYWTARLADPSLLTAWRARLSTLGTRVTVRHVSDPSVVGAVISGQAIDIGEDGALVVQSDDGQIHRFLAGDVSLG